MRRFGESVQLPALTAESTKSSHDIQLCFLHAIGVLAPTALFFVNAPSWWVLGIGGASITFIYLWIGYKESRTGGFWLSPTSFFFFWYAIGYGVAAVYAAGQAYDPGYLNLVATLVDGDDLAKGYLLSLWGALAWHSGFVYTRRLQKPISQASSVTRSDFRLWFIGWLVGLLSLVLPEYFDSIGAARAILQLAPFGVMLSFSSLPATYFRLSRRLYIFYLICGNGLLIAAAFYDGSKYYSMLAFLPLVSAAVVNRSLRRTLPLIFAAGALLYLFAVAPVIMTARQITNVDSKLLRLEIAVEEVSGSFQEDVLYELQDEVQKFLYRQFESTAVGFIVSDVREHGLRHGETMRNLTYAFVPRVLWPSKPVVTRGNWFTAYLGGAPSEEESETSTGMYPAGELYWNFGVPGVICGMFIMGCFFNLLYSASGVGPPRQILMIILFMTIIARTVDQAAATEIFVLLVYLAILIVLYKHIGRLLGRGNIPHRVRTV